MKYNLLNGANLAYIGDAYYELQVRKYLLDKNVTNNKELKKLGVKYVSASAHALIYSKIKDCFTDE